MDINFNGTATGITTVDFNGNSDIIYVNLNGTVVWTKAPTVLEVVQALVDDAGGWTSIDRNATRTDDYIKLHAFVQDNTSYRDLTNTPDFSSLTGALASSPYVSNMMITYGDDGSGGEIGQAFWNGGNVNTNTEVKYTGRGQWLSLATAHINDSLSNVTSYGYNCRGAGNDAPIGYINLILPNKWTASLVGTGAGSTTLASGEILVVFNNVTSYDSANQNYSTENTVTHGNNSVVYRHQHHWYRNNSIGIFANATSSDQSISWVKPTVGEGQTAYTRVAKFTMTGIS